MSVKIITLGRNEENGKYACCFRIIDYDKVYLEIHKQEDGTSKLNKSSMVLRISITKIRLENWLKYIKGVGE